MTTLSRRALLSATGAVSLTAILAACADTGADGQAVSGGGDADYDTVITRAGRCSRRRGRLELGFGDQGGRCSQDRRDEDRGGLLLGGCDHRQGHRVRRRHRPDPGPLIIGGDDARALLDITQVTSDTRETTLENGSVQAVIATYSITPERAQKIDYAGPYYSSGQAVLVRDDEDRITGVGDLAASRSPSSPVPPRSRR